jgi:hypothetical protein
MGSPFRRMDRPVEDRIHELFQAFRGAILSACDQIAMDL